MSKLTRQTCVILSREMFGFLVVAGMVLVEELKGYAKELERCMNKE